MMDRRGSRKSVSISFGFAALIMFCFAPNALAQQVYSNNFTGGAGGEWSSASTSTSNGEVFLAESSEGSSAGTNTLSLANLPAHESVTVTFDLYIIESWDGNAEWCCGPDTWQLTADGTLVFTSNFANYTGGGIQTQAYPAEIAPNGAGATNPVGTGASATGHLGFGSGDFGDRTYSLSFTFPHTASSIALGFTSGQDQQAGDEGWGLDNVTVTVGSTSVTPRSIAPVPSTNVWGVAAMIMLLITFGLVVLRKRT